MKNFWPQRSKAEGFLIQNLARKYRSKISRSSEYSNESVNQIINNINLKFREEEGEKALIANLSTKSIHWANRDFSEYKEVA